MTRGEWIRAAQMMTANWPHQQVPDASLAKWFDDLRDLEAEQVYAAIEAAYRDGEKFVPNGAQIRAKVIDLSADVPAWGEVWRKVDEARRRFGHPDVPAAVAWLAEWHPLAGMFARQLGLADIWTTTDPVSVIEAQARGKWNGLTDQVRRDASYRGIPPAGLRGLERANSQPRQIGDVLRELETTTDRRGL